MSRRPNRKIAIDGKSYKVINYDSKTMFLLPKNRDEWVNEDLHEPAVICKIEECSEDEGLIIVWENTDGLVCPLCNENKPCFQKAVVYASTNEKLLEKNGKQKRFRLIAKKCPVAKESYLFQEVSMDGLRESLGNVITQAVIRVISNASYSEICILCRSEELVKQPVRIKGISQIRCKGCKGNFYITDYPILSSKDFPKACLACNKVFSHNSDFEVDVDSMRGCYVVKCRACTQFYVLLGEDSHTGNDFLVHALSRAELTALWKI
jgi:transposase-like protein